MSPSRPRSHEVETESERTFAYLLPSSWVIRKQDHDYGIDAEVEIFEDGHSTGLTFKVQLKGTDTDRRCSSIRLDTLNYWRSLDVPVLVIHYERGTGHLYGRWAYAHDLHVHGPSAAQQTTTFHFADSNRLVRDTIRSQLREDVQRFRDVRRGSVVEPLTYAVEFGDVPEAQRHHLALRQLLDSAPLWTSPAPADVAVLHIKVSPTGFQVTGPVALATLTVDTVSPSPGQYALNIVAAMGFVLATLGAGVHGVDLFIVAGGARLLHSFEIAATAGTCFGATGRYADAMTLGAPLVRDPDPFVRNAGNLLLAMAISGNVVPQAVGEELLRVDHDLIELEIAQDKPLRAAVAYYNFGEHLASFGQHHLALAAYTAAAHYDPRYSDFDYFHRDLGCAHRHLGDYGAAASAYQTALQRGGDPSQIVPLLADSLLLSGRYRETIDLLADWDPAGSPSAAHAELVGIVAGLVVRTTGLEQQVRRDPVPDEDVPLSDPRCCRRLLIDVDALDFRYWLGAADVLPDEDELAYVVLLAHLSEDPRFWAAATVTAYRLGSPLVTGVVEQAYRCCDERYLNVLAHMSESDEDVEPWFDVSGDELATLVEEVYRQLATRPDTRSVPVLRLVTPEH